MGGRDGGGQEGGGGGGAVSTACRWECIGLANKHKGGCKAIKLQYLNTADAARFEERRGSFD